MGFEQAREAMAEATTSQSDSGPASSDVAPETQSSSEGQIASEIMELDKLDKFKFEGRELTPSELKKAILFQSDYTKKTQSLAQERKNWESQISQAQESQKFADNLDADLNNVLEGRASPEAFKNLYPARYHGILDRFLANNQGQAATRDQRSPSTNVDPAIMSKLSNLERKVLEREQKDAQAQHHSEVKANTAVLESAMGKFMPKYKMADEDAVLGRMERLIDQGKLGDPKSGDYLARFNETLESLYKASHEGHQKKYQDFYKEQVNQQKQANSKGRDTASGGGIPGQAPAKMKLKDVKNHMIATLDRQTR